jgi:hypothetical protein
MEIRCLIMWSLRETAGVVCSLPAIVSTSVLGPTSIVSPASYCQSGDASNVLFSYQCLHTGEEFRSYFKLPLYHTIVEFFFTAMGDRTVVFYVITPCNSVVSEDTFPYTLKMKVSLSSETSLCQEIVLQSLHIYHICVHIPSTWSPWNGASLFNCFQLRHLYSSPRQATWQPSCNFGRQLFVQWCQNKGLIMRVFISLEK